MADKPKMSPAERELLVYVATCLRSLVAEQFTGVTLPRRDCVQKLDARIAAVQAES